MINYRSKRTGSKISTASTTRLESSCADWPSLRNRTTNSQNKTNRRRREQKWQRLEPNYLKSSWSESGLHPNLSFTKNWSFADKLWACRLNRIRAEISIWNWSTKRICTRASLLCFPWWLLTATYRGPSSSPLTSLPKSWMWVRLIIWANREIDTSHRARMELQ